MEPTYSSQNYHLDPKTTHSYLIQLLSCLFELASHSGLEQQHIRTPSPNNKHMYTQFATEMIELAYEGVGTYDGVEPQPIKLDFIIYLP